MSYKPNETQELLARNSQIRARVDGGDTDRHRLNDMLWESLRNNDEATREIDLRLVKLETTLLVIKWVLTVGVPAILALLASLHLRLQT